MSSTAELAVYLRRTLAAGQWPKAMQLLHRSRHILGPNGGLELRERLIPDFRRASWYAGLVVFRDSLTVARDAKAFPEGKKEQGKVYPRTGAAVEHLDQGVRVLRQPAADAFLNSFAQAGTAASPPSSGSASAATDAIDVDQRDRIAIAAAIACRTATPAAQLRGFPIVALGNWREALKVFRSLSVHRLITTEAVGHAMACLTRKANHGRSHPAVTAMLRYYELRAEPAGVVAQAVAAATHASKKEAKSGKPNDRRDTTPSGAGTATAVRPAAADAAVVFPPHIAWLRQHARNPNVGIAACRAATWYTALQIGALFYRRYVTSGAAWKATATTTTTQQQRSERSSDRQQDGGGDLTDAAMRDGAYDVVRAAALRLRGLGLWREALAAVVAAGGVRDAKMANLAMALVRDAKLPSDSPVPPSVGESVFRELLVHRARSVKLRFAASDAADADGEAEGPLPESVLAGVVRLLPWQRALELVVPESTPDTLPRLAMLDKLVAARRWAEALVCLQGRAVRGQAVHGRLFVAFLEQAMEAGRLNDATVCGAIAHLAPHVTPAPPVAMIENALTTAVLSDCGPNADRAVARALLRPAWLTTTPAAAPWLFQRLHGTAGGQWAEALHRLQDGIAAAAGPSEVERAMLDAETVTWPPNFSAASSRRGGDANDPLTTGGSVVGNGSGGEADGVSDAAQASRVPLLKVKRIPTQMGEEELRRTFRFIGPVSECRQVIARNGNRFAFVRYTREADAERALRDARLKQKFIIHVAHEKPNAFSSPAPASPARMAGAQASARGRGGSSGRRLTPDEDPQDPLASWAIDVDAAGHAKKK